MKLAQAGLLVSFVAAGAMTGCSSASKIPYVTDAHVRSTPDTVVVGHLPAGRKPVLTVESGQVVRIEETVDFLGHKRNLSPQDAYSLASIGVNYAVAEAVDHVLMIYGEIPKKIFATNAPFWSGAR